MANSDKLVTEYTIKIGGNDYEIAKRIRFNYQTLWEQDKTIYAA